MVDSTVNGMVGLLLEIAHCLVSLDDELAMPYPALNKL